jgi:hypothetical protein
MAAPAPSHQNSVLDAIGLVEARLRRDGPALACLLDAGDNRAQASMCADMLARFLTAWCPDPLAALAELRPVLMDG